MSKKIRTIFSSVTGLGLVLVIAGVFLVAAQEPITGEWRANLNDKTIRVLNRST